MYPNSNFALNPQEKGEILSDPTFNYISRCLLEEDVEEDISDYEGAALKNMEKPFYDILGEKYPPSQDSKLLSSQLNLNPNFTISIPNFSDTLKQHTTIESLIDIEFQRGVEEGMKLLPNLNKLSIDGEGSKISLDARKKRHNDSLEFKLIEDKASNLSDLNLLEVRNCKIPVFSCEETIRDEMLDKSLLNHEDSYARKEILSLRGIMELKEKSCIKNQNQDDHHTNLRALLISCAEAISMDNNTIAGELLNEIRMQASPTGDGIQRLACILADGLEARLAGSGSATYHRLVTRQLSTADFLNAFHVCIRASPMIRVSYHFANMSILNAAGTASKIHIVDIGISYGFQWPSLIQALAKRKGGPPNLRITGIDWPQPGFRPAERIKETGRRLEAYAQEFKVPFEYQGTATQWESICIADLSINNDELRIVNSMYGLSRVRDEPLLGINSPRNQLLKLIQETKAKVFVQGIFNVSFSPFFITRVRKVLLHYSKLFDMLDTLVPRDYKSRELIERTFYSPCIINQIACEGSELVVRPETYKQWHKRDLQAGFQPLPVDPSVVEECQNIVRNGYTEGFYIEIDNHCLLQGWKGSINYAISLWKSQVE
ncbi:hypothetical protein LUZ62_020015 [Rhynchospora pubera]|uniref:Uncharacterized protein n=1 Tax=Rhynchospora pubera TaxID=906938 RepID=A0AAV8GR16_9POAL|nr:hypothetical protein LUZ62_020015 [Rhynchospora pubera]